MTDFVLYLLAVNMMLVVSLCLYNLIPETRPRASEWALEKGSGKLRLTKRSKGFNITGFYLQLKRLYRLGKAPVIHLSN